MPRRPIVCHVIHRLAVGGLENGLVNLINNLPDDAYGHAIVCVSDATEFRARIRRRDVAIHAIGKRPGKDLAAYARMWRLLRRMRPRIVHTRNLPALDMIGPAWLAGVRRFVHSEHGLDLIELDGRHERYNRLRRFSRLTVDRYITVSADLQAWLGREIGVAADRVETIYNGVDTERFAPASARHQSILPAGFAPPGALVIATLGRLDPLKNQTGLVRAFLRVLELRPELRQWLRLAIVGDGDERAKIDALLAEGGAKALAWLPGFRDDTPDFYRSIDLFVLPSFREGISNTLLEAMASGCPVIAAGVGGNPEILPDGIAGTLVSTPEPEILAEAILRYADDAALRRAHGAGGREHVLGRFSLKAMVDRYDRVYRSLT